MFQRLSKGSSHRQRLEMHAAMVAMEVSHAAAPPHSPCRSPMSVEPESPVPAARRASLQLDHLERPMHRHAATPPPPMVATPPNVYHGRNVFVQYQQQQQQQQQGHTEAYNQPKNTQLPVTVPATNDAVPGATDLACLYLPHNDPSRRRSSLDCIRSTRRSDRPTAPAGAAAPDSNSVHARSQIRAGGAYVVGREGGSDSEEEVSSSTRFPHAAVPAGAHAVRRARGSFSGMDSVTRAHVSRSAAGAPAGAPTGRSLSVEFWGGIADACTMGAHGDVVRPGGASEHDLHPARLMQARAAMVAQCQGAAMAPAQQADTYSMPQRSTAVRVSNPWAL